MISYNKFINEELIHFSVYNIERSIPSICDGLKISTRKILFSCFKKNLDKRY
jgi:DNA topoisomerase-2